MIENILLASMISFMPFTDKIPSKKENPEHPNIRNYAIIERKLELKNPKLYLKGKWKSPYSPR